MTLRDLPLSAPLWLWLMYGFTILIMAVIACAGGLAGLIGVVGATAFSFQFWTYAVWRGLILAKGKT